MCLVVGNRQNGFHIIPGRFCRLLGQSGTSAVQPGKLYHSCTEYTGIAHRFPSQRQSQRTSLHIGGRTHRGPLPFTGHAVRYHSAVSCGINVRKIGTHFLIYENSPLKHLHTRIFTETRIRTDTDR